MLSPKLLISLVLIALGAVFTAPLCYAVDVPNNTLTAESFWTPERMASVIGQCNDALEQNPYVGESGYNYGCYFVDNGAMYGGYSSLIIVSKSIPTSVYIGSNKFPQWNENSTLNPWDIGILDDAYSFTVNYDVQNDLLIVDSSSCLNFGNYTSIGWTRSNMLIANYDTDFDSFSPEYKWVNVGSAPPTDSFPTLSSDFELFSAIFNIYFVPKSASNDNSIAQSMLDNRYPCYLVSVSSDNGYNMASLQCPALLQSSDTVFYGIFYLEPAKKPDLDIYQMTLSFASDVPIPQADDPDFFIEPDSFFKLVVDTAPDITVIDNALSFTVNSMTFLNSNNAVLHYGSRTLKAFDYSSERDGYNIYSYWGTCNSSIYSAGSFIYNFNYTNILDVNDNNSPLDDDDIDDLKEEGEKKNTKKREDSPYVAKYNIYPDTSTGFVFPDNLSDYDFRPLKSIFDALFNWYVLELLGISCTVGLIAYTLFGRGD